MLPKHSAWSVMFVAFLAGGAVTINQFRVPPALPALGIDMAAINVVSNVGMLPGPPLLGAVVAWGQWMDGSTLLLAATHLGVLAALLAWRTMEDW